MSEVLKTKKAEDRVHHKTSPSSLQAREACSHWESEGTVSDAATAGTRQHAAVEARDITSLPTDEEASAVVKCIEFTDGIEAEFAELAKKTGQKYTHLNEVYVHVDDRDTSAGYLDEAFICGDKGALIDYKFGQWEVEPTENNLQAFAYVLGLFKQFPQLAEITAYFVMPYLDSIDMHTFKRADLQGMLLRIMAVVERSKAKTGKPSPAFLACYSCKNKATCPALAATAIKVSEKFAPLKTPKELDPMKVADQTDAVLGYQLAGIMEAWARAYKGRITNLAVEDDKFLPPGYRVISSADRKIVDAAKAFKVLQPILGDEALWKIMKVGISGVEDAVKAKAPRGQKTAQALEVVEMLENSGLIEREEEKVYLRAVSASKDSE
jgi:hypothetical protein